MRVRSRTVGTPRKGLAEVAHLLQLRYAYHRLTDLAGCDDADSEFARDTWCA